MRALLQRVSRASVTVNGKTVGAIETGLLVLAGIHQADTAAQIPWYVDKIANLRIFPDDEGKMNRSVLDVGGAVLVVSQFTLYGDVQKGRRPSFIEAGRPEVAIPLYERFVQELRATGLRVETGEFGADMQVVTVDFANPGRPALSHRIRLSPVQDIHIS